jgi:hypothetical protein
MAKKMKGVSTVFVNAIVALLALAVGVVIFFFFFGHIFIIIPILKESEIERHSIILANLYISSDKLTYSDGSRSYRGIFDKSKLDKEMVTQSNALSFLNIFQQSDLLQNISYPNSVVILTVTDLDNNNRWYVSGRGDFLGTEGTSAQSYFECMISHIRIDAASFFRGLRGSSAVLPFNPINAFWTDYDMQACQQVFNSKQGVVAFKTFPVSIRYSDNDVHLGVLSLSLAEV